MIFCLGEPGLMAEGGGGLARSVEMRWLLGGRNDRIEEGLDMGYERRV